MCVCFFFFLSAVVSATWSNLVAYLWHSLAIVLMDVVGVSERAGKSELLQRQILDGGQVKIKVKKIKPTTLVLPASLQDCYRST